MKGPVLNQILEGCKAYKRAKLEQDQASLSTITSDFPEFATVMEQLLNSIETGDVETLTKLAKDVPELLKLPGPTSPLLYGAARIGKPLVIKALIELGVDPNAKHHSFGANALNAAASVGDMETVTLLYEAGAAMDLSTMNTNPLIASVHGRNVEVAKYLIEAGIDTNVQYETDRPIPKIDALYFAIEMGARDIAKAIALSQSNGEELAAQRLIKTADQMAAANTTPATDGP